VLEPARTVAIIAGASDWPLVETINGSQAFAESASALRAYLTSPLVGLPTENLLWLFDETDHPRQYVRISEFLDERLPNIAGPKGAGAFVLFAYIGHGSVDGDFHLLLRDARTPIVAETSLRASALAEIVRTGARSSKCLLLLDCCFAGSAVAAFQAPLNEAVKHATEEIVIRDPEPSADDRGLAVLCASSARSVAKLDLTAGRTMFTSEFVEVLWEGDPGTPGGLSPRRVCDLVARRLRARHGPDAPRPEVHSPYQFGGDLASELVFPNPARVTAPAGVTWNDVAEIEAIRRSLALRLRRAHSMVDPKAPDLEPHDVVALLAELSLIVASEAAKAQEILELPAELSPADVSDDVSARLIHFGRTVLESLVPTVFERLVCRALEEHGWTVVEVIDVERQRRGWRPDLRASRGGDEVTVLAKTATKRSSPLLRDALRRVSKDPAGVVVVVPAKSATEIPPNTSVPVLRFDEFLVALEAPDRLVDISEPR
jgi:hypothetical protein